MSKLDDLSTFTDLSSLSEFKEINITRKVNNVPLNKSVMKQENPDIKQQINKTNTSSQSSNSSSQSSSNSSSQSSSNSSSQSSSNSSSQCFDKSIMNKVYIDIAVVTEEYTKIELMCDDHIVNLDEIDVSIDIFQTMFYPYRENFGINKDFFSNNSSFISFISFSPQFRTINGKKFDLLEELIGNIESDLSVSRNCFTKDSLVELTNEITNIKSLLDIKCCSVMSSLTWENILDIINNYKLTKCEVIPVLIINIVFKSDTTNVKDTIIRFQYKICKNT